jgi:AraC-like DNA-binding protein
VYSVLIEQRDKLREKFSNEPGIVRPAMCTTERDKEFADRLAAILEQNLARPEFSIDEFAQLMKLGRTVFYRKLRGVTGYSPNEYLRVVRMKKRRSCCCQKIINGCGSLLQGRHQ